MVEEAEVLNILTQVNVVRRECEIVSVATGVCTGRVVKQGSLQTCPDPCLPG